jgi:hypothetical protein
MLAGVRPVLVQRKGRNGRADRGQAAARPGDEEGAPPATANRLALCARAPSC